VWIRVRWGQILGRNPALRIRERRHFRVQFKRFLGNPTPGSPFCARSRTTVQFQTGSGPGVPILVKAHAPPTPSAFEKLPRPQLRSQALYSWEGDNHGVAAVALFFAESDHGQPRRQGWQISNISTLSYTFPIPIFRILYGRISMWSLFCDTEIMLSQSTSFLNDDSTYSPRGWYSPFRVL
jgi:hypothetical protein